MIQPDKGAHGELTVPVKSLDTGIPLRNEHLAGVDWLNAGKNPTITFKITEIQNVKIVKSTFDARTYDVVAGGDFRLNGVTRRLRVPARLTYLKESNATKQRMPGNLLAVRTSFELSLADFGIKSPKGNALIGSRVGETVKVEATIVASSANSAMALNAAGK